MRYFICLWFLLALRAHARPEPIVVYNLSGGIAGRMESLTVYPNGTASYQVRTGQPQEAHLPPHELRAVEKAAAKSLDVKSPAPQPIVPDGMSYSLDIHTHGKSVHIGWGDPSPTPEALRPLLEALTRVQRHFLKT